ncbi:hypothetical protein QNO07_01170 [Streptomyces sp. 549]|uniref:hypothetical protein n=1 Tax=Streptomyces sp. 549 TaxID=3049076 RepID=UPI0024C2F300|nr:hypothetical protein [Streptomyces sp. 549]MDK1472051.1 hypothetical protein [Streptomyces sp. 549]
MRQTISRPVFRRLAGGIAACLTLTASSGCSVPVDGVAGISVTSDGHLLGVMMVCGHRIDGATLYVDSGDVDKAVTVGAWSADRPISPGLTTWTLDPPSAGWTADTPLTPLTATTTYTLYGWTRDNSWSARSVSFAPADLETLTPGMVRYHAFSDTGEETTATVTTAEFEARACAHT